MKLFALKSIKLGVFTLAISILPIISASASVNKLSDVSAHHHSGPMLKAHEVKNMLGFEGFEGQLNRYMDTQEAYYLYTALNSDFYQDNLAANSFIVLGQEGLQDALAYNENGFQTLIESGSGNANYAKQFADILRREAAYFVSYQLTLIDGGDPTSILLEWAELPALYGQFFGEFQPKKHDLPAQITALATQMREAQILESAALANSFTTPTHLTEAILQFNIALALAKQIIHIAVPKD